MSDEGKSVRKRQRFVVLPMLTKDDVAEALKVSPQTVVRLIENHNLPASKVGTMWRVNPYDLVEYLNRGRSDDTKLSVLNLFTNKQEGGEKNG